MNVGQSDSVLDIGDDVGALVLYTDPARDGEEIDIIDVVHPDRRTHSQVHRRTANGRAVWAAVYPQLRAGEYRLTRDPTGPDDLVTIAGGAITELDWRAC
jgi:hypothetical protein